jgi:DivIVA domain-containing protein
MQSDIDAQLTNFFEEAPPREFATVMRGYDRHQVDEHIRQIEAKCARTASRPRLGARELSEAHRQIQEQERPTYSGLGARIEQLLRLAEEQATELVQAARSEANEIKAAAKVDAAELRAGPRTRPPSCAPTPSARPTTCAARPSARPTRSGPPPGARLTS